MTATELLLYSRNYKRQNRPALYAIVVLTSGGIGVQEFLNTDVRVSYLALTLGAILLYIYFTEFSQQRSDEILDRQQKLLAADALTGLRSRHAYSARVTELKQQNDLPKDMTIIALDLDGLKTVNDTKGHKAGDELICGAAECIANAFDRYGECYRTGGDEFVVILQVGKKRLLDLKKDLDQEIQGWIGYYSFSLSISYGWARAEDHPECRIEELIGIADKQMYETKEKHHQKGKHR